MAAVEATRMPMVLSDPTIEDNPIIYANAAFLELCGFGMEEVLGRTYMFLAGLDTDTGTASRIRVAMSTRERLVEDVLLYRKDGTPIWVAMFVSPVVVDGVVIQHFASFLDVTRRVEAEAALARANEDLERRVQDRTRALERINDRLEAEIERRIGIEALLRDTVARHEETARYNAFLAKEIEHRTRNTLQFASSMLGFQASGAAHDATRTALRSAQDRLVRMARMQAHLYRGDEAGSIDFGAYLATLAQDVLETMEPVSGRIALSVDGTALVLGPDLALPLGLIVSEAITNAVKHGFPDGESGRIRVGLHPLSTGMMCLSVEDDGVGIKDAVRPGGMGVDLVAGLASKVKGTAKVGPRPGGGTRLSVVFPVPCGA